MNPDADSLSVVLSWLARTSIQSSVLIALVLVVQGVFRDKLAPRWRYGLWLLVMIRLALPWAPESQVSVYNLVPSTWDRLAVAGASAELATGPSPHGDHLDGQTSSPDSKNPRGLERDGRQAAATTASGSAAGHLILIWAAAILWLLGALGVVACALLQSYRLAAAVVRQRPVTDRRTLELLASCKKEMGVRACLTVVETPLVKSPALFGCVRPRLLLPAGAAETLGRDRLRHVFLHELAHLKRHDIAVNWLMTILQALHWFNPLVWYAFYRARCERELACDAMTLSHGREGEAREYGRTIIYLLETLSQQRRLPSLAGVLEDRTQVKRRMRMIAHFKKTSRWWQALACALIIVLGGVALTNADQSPARPSINDLVAKLDIDKATLDDVIRIFGEPNKYVWGKKVFKKEDLHDQGHFIAVYDGGFRVFMANGKIMELRSERDPDCLHRGKLRVGSSLETALEVMGKPAKTVVGEKNMFQDSVLYRDIDGHKGRCYYARADKNLRLFFADDKVVAFYLTRSDFGEGRRKKPAPPRKGATIDEIRKDRPWIPKTTVLDEKRHLKDKTDYPFVSDPELLGTWKVVDFVNEKDQFVPGKVWWRGDLDFLKGMRFDKDGTVAVKMRDDDWRKYGAKWTKGLVMHRGTAPDYQIVEINGKKYLFYQWKSGDYTIRYDKPAYYVLEKVASGGE